MPISDTIFKLLITAFGFLSIVLGVYALAPKKKYFEEEEEEEAPLVQRGHLGAKRQELKELFLLYRITLPLVTWLAFFISKLPIEDYRNRLNRKLTAAGNPGAYNADEFIALRILVFFGIPILTFLLFTAMFGNCHPLILSLATLLGFFLPPVWLRDTLMKRAKEINRSLPYILDLLTLSIEAGLDFISSVERIVMKKESTGPLYDELFQMLQELKMGKTRREALRDMARRINLDNVNSVVAALIQADQLGTSLGPVLRIQSEMLRVRRSQQAEKLAMEAPVKLLFPLLFIFLAVIMLLLSPVVIRFIRGQLF